MTENSLNRYRAWRRHIGEVELDLKTYVTDKKNGYDRLHLVSIAERIARHGANGIGCYPSNSSIAKELDITRVTVDKYKDLAIELGWFTDTGKRKRQIPVLDISESDSSATL